MKISDDFHTRIGQLVDTYRGSVPLSRCIIEATHQQEQFYPPSLRCARTVISGWRSHSRMAAAPPSA